MNRTIGFGIALFFAILSIAVLGNQNEVAAGGNCAGVDGGCYAAGNGCNGGGCWGRRCHGRRLFRRGCHAAVVCHGAVDCAASCNGGGCHSRCHGLFARWRARRHCCGQPVDCCGQVVTCNGGCAGAVIEEAPAEAAPAEAPAEVPAAPAEESSAGTSAAPKVVYRSVVYRR